MKMFTSLEGKTLSGIAMFFSICAQIIRSLLGWREERNEFFLVLTVEGSLCEVGSEREETSGLILTWLPKTSRLQIVVLEHQELYIGVVLCLKQETVTKRSPATTCLSQVSDPGWISPVWRQKQVHWKKWLLETPGTAALHCEPLEHCFYELGVTTYRNNCEMNWKDHKVNTQCKQVMVCVWINL